MSVKTNLGRVTAYADAVSAGYKGTREQFAADQAEFAANAAAVAAAKKAAEESATAAEESQNNAATSAANASKSAESADLAKTAAQDAQTGAETAQEAAEQAQATAQSAQNAASASATAAGQSSAAAAQSAADASYKQSAANALTKTISGTAIRVDDVSPLQHKLLWQQYGACVQDGTPSIESPAPITGNVAGAAIASKNLFAISCDPAKVSTLNNQAEETMRYGFTLNLPSGVYTFSAVGTELSTQTGDYIYFQTCNRNAPQYEEPQKLVIVGRTGTKTITIGREYRITIYCALSSITLYSAIATFSHYNIQLEVGEIASSYEPYKEEMAITVTDPSGNPVTLYGVGNNKDVLVDNLDGTGTVTRKIGHIPCFDGEEISTDYISSTGALTVGADVYYVLEEPYVETVTISGAPMSNSQTTTWLSDCESDVTYNRDAVKVIDQLTQAIISLGGNL